MDRHRDDTKYFSKRWFACNFNKIAVWGRALESCESRGSSRHQLNSDTSRHDGRRSGALLPTNVSLTTQPTHPLTHSPTVLFTSDPPHPQTPTPKFHRLSPPASQPAAWSSHQSAASQPASRQPASKPASQPANQPASQPPASQPASQPLASQPAASQPASQPQASQPASRWPRTDDGRTTNGRTDDDGRTDGRRRRTDGRRLGTERELTVRIENYKTFRVTVHAWDTTLSRVLAWG
jgi:hypothetical protein